MFTQHTCCTLMAVFNDFTMRRCKSACRKFSLGCVYVRQAVTPPPCSHITVRLTWPPPETGGWMSSEWARLWQIDLRCVVLQSMALTTNEPDWEIHKLRSISATDSERDARRGGFRAWLCLVLTYRRGHRVFLLHHNANAADGAITHTDIKQD